MIRLIHADSFAGSCSDPIFLIADTYVSCSAGGFYHFFKKKAEKRKAEETEKRKKKKKEEEEKRKKREETKKILEKRAGQEAEYDNLVNINDERIKRYVQNSIELYEEENNEDAIEM